MSGCTPRLPKVLTCSEVDDNVNEEDGVRDAVEDHPSHGEVIVEEGDGNREDDQVGHEEKQHAKVPIKPCVRKVTFIS